MNGCSAGRVMTQEEYQLINEFLSNRFGLHFPEHKREILESRLRMRLSELQMRSFMEYYLRLQYAGNGGCEERHLLRSVTNNETYFFRETHQFDALVQQAIDGMKAAAAVPGELRFLCAGCSSGEEPYTLNIFLKENAYRYWGHKASIDAFDIDDERVSMAKEGAYGPSSLRGVEGEIVGKYFLPPVAGRYRLKPMYRENVNVFHANILELEGYRRPALYDALFCRNVLIYFSEPALHRAIDNFASCLRPGGLLFLGHSESIIGLTDRLTPVRVADCIAYQRVR